MSGLVWGKEEYLLLTESRIEIAETEPGEELFELFMPAADAERSFFRLMNHGAEIQLRVHIEIAKLDHIGPLVFNHRAEGAEFIGIVGKPGQDKIIEGNKALFGFHYGDRVTDILQ